MCYYDFKNREDRSLNNAVVIQISKRECSYMNAGKGIGYFFLPNLLEESPVFRKHDASIPWLNMECSQRCIWLMAKTHVSKNMLLEHIAFIQTWLSFYLFGKP